MNEDRVAVVSINQDYCSRCLICYSLCPYEAIQLEGETGKVEIDLQKCQVCGICYSACPSFAIEIAYYDYDSLLKHVEHMLGKVRAENIVFICRGNSPSTHEIKEILANQGLSVKDYIPLRLPCSGRMPAEFVFKVLGLGIKKIVSIQCEDEFCRFKEGTKINARRLALSRRVLEDLGFAKDTVTVVKYSRKVVYDTEKCVGCDKCVFICPYAAIEAESFATPKILYDYCMGCGACALVCPHNAIQLKGFEFETVFKRYSDSAAKLKSVGRSPVVLVFCCQWSEFSTLDNAESLFFKKNAVVLEVPCFKALDPVHIVNALQNGFDGVLAVVCSDQDCKIKEGRDVAERNINVLKNVLKKMGLLERFELFETAPRFVGGLEKKLDAFINRIAFISSAKL